MYVTDSLFYLQHIMGNVEGDENRQMHINKYSEILENFEHPKKQENADAIKDRFIAKSHNLIGGNNE